MGDDGDVRGSAAVGVGVGVKRGKVVGVVVVVDNVLVPVLWQKLVQWTGFDKGLVCVVCVCVSCVAGGSVYLPECTKKH